MTERPTWYGGPGIAERAQLQMAAALRRTERRHERRRWMERSRRARGRSAARRSARQERPGMRACLQGEEVRRVATHLSTTGGRL